MAKKAQPKAEPAPDTRDLVRDVVAEIIYRTPIWRQLQTVADVIVDDLRLGIAENAEDFFRKASEGTVADLTEALRRDAPGLWGEAGIGHNQPPEPPTPEQLLERLKATYPTLIKRAEDLTAAYGRFKKEVPAEIPDKHTQARATELVKQFNTLISMAEANHTVEKAPWLALGNVVQGFFGNIWGPFAGTKKSRNDKKGTPGFRDFVLDKMDAFAIAEAAESRKTAAAAALKLQTDAAEAAARAAETMEHEDLAKAAGAAEAATQAAAHAAGPQADHSRTRGEFGAVSSIVVTWDVQVTDLKLLPDEFKIADLAALKAALKLAPRNSANEPVWAIAGTELVKNESTRVR